LRGRDKLQSLSTTRGGHPRPASRISIARAKARNRAKLIDFAQFRLSAVPIGGKAGAVRQNPAKGKTMIKTYIAMPLGSFVLSLLLAQGASAGCGNTVSRLSVLMPESRQA